VRNLLSQFGGKSDNITGLPWQIAGLQQYFSGIFLQLSQTSLQISLTSCGFSKIDVNIAIGVASAKLEVSK